MELTVQNANTAYDTTHPWQTMAENQVSRALSGQANLSTKRIESLKPPIRNIGKPAPKRFGMGEATQPTIHDVLAIDMRFPIPRVDYTGSQAGYTGTSYPALGVM
jgi:hypothetical protein